MTNWHGIQVRFADPVNACVLWRIEFDLVRGCNHGFLITATLTNVPVRRLCVTQRTAVACPGSWFVRTSKVY